MNKIKYKINLNNLKFSDQVNNTMISHKINKQRAFKRNLMMKRKVKARYFHHQTFLNKIILTNRRLIILERQIIKLIKVWTNNIRFRILKN